MLIQFVKAKQILHAGSLQSVAGKSYTVSGPLSEILLPVLTVVSFSGLLVTLKSCYVGVYKISPVFT